MGTRKAALADHEQYQRIARAWRASEILKCRELGRDGPVELRTEDGRWGLWDDLVEEISTGEIHAWQVKDQKTTFAPEPFLELIRSLHSQPGLARGHLLVSGRVTVRIAGELQVLADLGARWGRTGIDPAAALAQLTGAQRLWVHFLEEGLGIDALAVVGLVGRLSVVEGLSAEELAVRARESLAMAGLVDPKGALARILAWLDDRNHAEHRCTPELLWEEALNALARAPVTRPARLRERRLEYLDGVRSSWLRMPVLRGLRDSAGLGILLEAVWVHRRLIELGPVEPPEENGPSTKGPKAPANGSRPPLRARELSKLVRAGGRRTIAILGGAGEGKSQLLHRLRYELAQDALVDSRAPVPLLVSAAALGEASLPEALDRMGTDGAGDLARSRVPCVVLVDAFDEVPSTRVGAALERLGALADDRCVQAVIITTRASFRARLPRVQMVWRLEPWGPPDLEEFLDRWAQQDPTAARRLREEPATRGLLSNPLLATLAALTVAGAPMLRWSRSALFERVMQRLFVEWTEAKGHDPASLSELWAQVEPHLAELAWRMLSGREASLPRDEVWRALAAASRIHATRWLDWADRQVGILVANEPDQYTFLLRSFAEHLAGRRLAERGVEEVVRFGNAPWAEEVVLHAVGILAQREERKGAEAAILGLLDGWQEDYPEGVLVWPRHLRPVLIALRAASELDAPGDQVLANLEEAALAGLTEETSVWVGDRFAEVLRGHAAANSALWMRLRGPLARLLSDPRQRPADWFAQRQEHPRRWLLLLLHRDPGVRSVALEHLSERAHHPEDWPLLLSLLMDDHVWSWDGPVPLQAARLLRRIPREPAFEAFKVHLLSVLGRGFVPGVPAAIALRPGEAPVDRLAEGLARAGQADWKIQEELAELAAFEGGEAALDREWPEWRKRVEAPQPPVRSRPEVGGENQPFTLTVHRRLLEILQVADSWLSEEQAAVMTQLTRGGAGLVLGMLCRRARQDPAPLISVLSGEWDNPAHRSPRMATNQGIRTTDQEPLGEAVLRHPDLRRALLDAWSWFGDDHANKGFRWTYPGRALEAAIRLGDSEAEAIYAAWLPHTQTFLRGFSGLVPVDILARPGIREVAMRSAEEMFRWASVRDEKGVRGAPSTAAAGLLDRAPTWYDSDVLDGVVGWLESGDAQETAAAFMALSRPDAPLPEGLREGNTLEQALHRMCDSGDAGDWFQFRNALAHLVGSPLVPILEGALRDLVQELDGDVLVLAAAALFPQLAREEAQALVQRVAQSFPANWSALRQEGNAILVLVASHPAAFAERIDVLVEQEPFAALECLPLLLPHVEPTRAQGWIRRILDTSIATSLLPWRGSFGGARRSGRLADLVYQHCFDLGIHPWEEEGEEGVAET